MASLSYIASFGYNYDDDYWFSWWFRNRFSFGWIQRVSRHLIHISTSVHHLIWEVSWSSITIQSKHSSECQNCQNYWGVMGGGAQDSFCHAWILKATVMIEQAPLSCCRNNIPIILAPKFLTLFVGRSRPPSVPFLICSSQPLWIG